MFVPVIPVIDALAELVDETEEYTCDWKERLREVHSCR